MFDTLKFEKSDDRTMVLTRRFNAPRELVFAAYTTPALMGRWLIGPPGWSMQVCEFKPIAGFRYRLAWRNEAESVQTIELTEDAGVPEGQGVEVQLKISSEANRSGDGIQRSAGALANDPDFDDIMDEVYRARKLERVSRSEDE